MNPDPKPCEVKGCTEKTNHHHNIRSGMSYPCVTPCLIPEGATSTNPLVAPRVTKSARIAALEAENAALIEQGWADAKMIVSLSAKLAAESEPPTVSVEPYPGIPGTVTVHIDGKYVGMVFGDYPGRLSCHATAKWLGLGSFHSTQAEAVAAIVAAWQRVQA